MAAELGRFRHHEEEDEDKEESTSSYSKKRTASKDIEEEQRPPALKKQCRPKLVLPDSSDSDEESEASKKVPEKAPRVKPIAASYIFLGFLDCFITNSPLQMETDCLMMQPATWPLYRADLGGEVPAQRTGGHWICVALHTSPDP